MALPPTVKLPPTSKLPVIPVTASTTLVPSQNSRLVLPLEIAIPLPEAVLTVTVSPVPFFTMYTLLRAGHIRLAAPLKSLVESVSSNIALDSAVVPFAVDNVAELPLHVFIVFNPAMASSTIEVMLLFTTSPQDPLSSP